MLPPPPPAAAAASGAVWNSTSMNTPAARPRTTTASPPGGRRVPTVLSCKSASVTSCSPTQTPTAASLIKRRGWPSPEYQSDQRRFSSSSNLSLPSAGPAVPQSGPARRADGRSSDPEAAPVRSTNVRRSMIPMLAALLALSTPLAGQSGGQHARGGRGAWVLGFAGTLGGGWQVEAADVGYARVVAAGPLRIATLSARIGSFIDEGAIIGGSRGFLAGLTLGGRTKPVRLADLGTETSTSEVGGDLAIEATGYVGANSPLPQGAPWGGVL